MTLENCHLPSVPPWFSESRVGGMTGKRDSTMKWTTRCGADANRCES
jgi:hypothetical protein